MFNTRIMLSMVLILSMLFLPACGRKNNLEKGDKNVIARINNYRLTIDDFKPEMRASLAGNLSDVEFEKAKENLLDEIITKKILLQEAQKENFDKDKAFVKEIERYWEQALLKLLYDKKSQELLRSIKVDEAEVMTEYKRLAGEGSIDQAAVSFEKMLPELKEDIRNRKVRKALNEWIDGLKNRANVKKYKDNLKAIGRE